MEECLKIRSSVTLIKSYMLPLSPKGRNRYQFSVVSNVTGSTRHIQIILRSIWLKTRRIEMG